MFYYLSLLNTLLFSLKFSFSWKLPILHTVLPQYSILMKLVIQEIKYLDIISDVI